MLIIKSKIDRQNKSIIVELLKFEDDNIFLLVTKLLDDNSYLSTLYYCHFADAFEYKYNTEGTEILHTKSKSKISNIHLNAKDKLFFAFENDNNRYYRTLEALKD